MHKFDECKSTKNVKRTIAHCCILIQQKKTNLNKTLTTAMCATVDESNTSEVTNISANIASVSSRALLATALVSVKAKNGEMILMRALIDQGSQGTFIRESAAQLLKLPYEKITAEVSGIATVIKKAVHRI